MGIDLKNEKLIAFCELSSWTEKNLGNRIAGSTAHRWRLRGCRSVRLETILIGGRRFTSVEALQRFFDSTTLAQDGPAIQSPLPSVPIATPKVDSYLASEGFD